MAPLGQKKVFFWAQKNFWNLFSKSLSQNLRFDTKTNLLSFVDPKLWPFKKYWYPKIAKFWNAHNTPLGVLGPKNFGFPSFSPGGTSMPKMIKIGEIRVLIYFDLPWNEPITGWGNLKTFYLFLTFFNFFPGFILLRKVKKS